MEAPVTKEYPIEALSKRMFWDTPIENIHGVEHCHFIIERVMRYGRIADWELIRQWYGPDVLREVVVELRDLEDISIAFLCLVLGLKREDFRCYTRKQSQPSFWDY
jgi:hypothetical protein